jgi:hypothetical protein
LLPLLPSPDSRALKKVMLNCSPAFTTDSAGLYFALNGGGTLTVGPGSDVCLGVPGTNFPGNHARGWLLQFSADLVTTKIPNAFGWDATASVVPANLVTSYTGPSTYLLLTRHKNYGSVGGDGIKKPAIVDPNVSRVDSITGATLTVSGPVVAPEPGGRMLTISGIFALAGHGYAARRKSSRCGIAENTPKLQCPKEIHQILPRLRWQLIEVIYHPARLRTGALMGANCFHQIGSTPVMQEEQPASKSPKGRGSEFISLCRALCHSVRQSPAHIVNNQIRIELYRLLAQRRR